MDVTCSTTTTIEKDGSVIITVTKRFAFINKDEFKRTVKGYELEKAFEEAQPQPDYGKILSTAAKIAEFKEYESKLACIVESIEPVKEVI